MINKISDTIVYNTLKNIKHGYLEIINFEGDVFKFGDLKEDLKVKIIIKHPGLNYKLIRYGSIGLAESYMQGYFQTDNLTNLIELTARNIDIIYKFSGILDLPLINYFKNKYVKNTK